MTVARVPLTAHGQRPLLSLAPDGSSHRAPSFPPLNPTTRPRPAQCMSGLGGGRLSQERSPVTTVGGPRRDAVDMDLWLDTQNRLVLALLHLYRPSSRDFRLLPRPSRTGSDARYDQILFRAADPGLDRPRVPSAGRLS